MLSLLSMASCYANNQSVVRTGRAIDLYADGILALKQGDYPRATGDFEGVLKQAGQASGSYFLVTTLREGDCLFFQGQYAQAKAKYKRVIDSVEGKSDFPNIDYAYFRLIQSHWLSKGETFFLVPPTDRRDQAEINAAYRMSRKFIAMYPNSPYMPEVMDIYHKVADTKISFEMEVARFYLARHKPLGAVFRLQRLLKAVPLANYRKGVIHRYILALKRAGKVKDVRTNCIKYRSVLGKEPICKG